MSKADEKGAVVLFERALSKVEKNMNALSLLMKHFEDSGFDKTKYSPQFQDMMGKFAKMMREYTRTEYEYEGPYTGEQTQERYKSSVAKSWKHKPEKPENADVPITEEEIKNAMNARAEKMEALQMKRSQQAFIEGTRDKPMIAGPDGKLKHDLVADAESSDEDDDHLINRVVSGDPNSGKSDTAKLRAAHLARLKNESAPNKTIKSRNTALTKMLKERGGDQFQDHRLDELDDVHTMQKGFLAEDNSDDEVPAAKSKAK